jgi:YD repeat-containing protein
MSDLAAWNVHGPVRRLRKEVAEWDENRADWKRPRGLTIAVFRPDGQLSESEFHEQAFSTATYTYDANGRLIERIRKMGALSDERTTFEYDDRGNAILESSEERHREVRMDADGVPQYTDQGTITQDTRFDYVYDEHGNWTERVAWHRVLTQVEFRRSNVERRAITYYEAPQPA